MPPLHVLHALLEASPLKEAQFVALALVDFMLLTTLAWLVLKDTSLHWAKLNVLLALSEHSPHQQI
jgi:hypothetical protein